MFRYEETTTTSYGGGTMREVTVKKDTLLDKLRTNLKNHQKVFDEAMEGYRKTAIELLDAAAADARAGKRIRRYIRIDEPTNQKREYERAIAMCEMSVDDTVTLSAQEFESYVMDRWPWRQNFLKTAANYSVTAAMDYGRETGGDDDDG